MLLSDQSATIALSLGHPDSLGECVDFDTLKEVTVTCAALPQCLGHPGSLGAVCVGFDDLKEELGDSRGSSMQRGESLDVSYDEEDLIKVGCVSVSVSVSVCV